ncbi:uncharacterized protein PADG_08359 [Paracoccidioides brasiliensis Pb18]|uniref:NAD(P)-binding protein n=1 Tax=Paracoccidioides brasiliensis (strain Pb18) TaxID=502780 RepID=C1GLW8_PARBD|nr:uncharacterized protein PADG_08359 [Paracoccidioides brasiliensis Pb18]EEH43434.2 hypothetical protein PADG_08359 [Paracoccidioides brasiliensis Pb18]
MPFTLLSLLATLVTSPTTRKTLLALLTIYFLRLLSRTLSSQIRNSWSRQRPWDNSRELVLITGGCSGIGKQIMLDLAARGVTVIIIDVKEPDFELPQTVTFHSTDVTSPSSLHSLHTHILSTHQRPPTVLINNAGIGLPNSILATPPSTIQQTFAVNTISHFWTAREFLPPMLKANHGHIVTVASMASFIGLGGMAPYSCSKASAMAFHEALGQELKLWYRADKDGDGGGVDGEGGERCRRDAGYGRGDGVRGGGEVGFGAEERTGDFTGRVWVVGFVEGFTGVDAGEGERAGVEDVERGGGEEGGLKLIDRCNR